jgi:hypothetical protein
LGHLSNLLRFSQASPSEQEALVEALSGAHWVAQATVTGSVGRLCGALIALSNYLDPKLHRLILADALKTRVSEELSKPFAGPLKEAARSVCLLGGFVALGGSIEGLSHPTFSKPYTAEELLRSLLPAQVHDRLGMYELQYWLGLRALHERSKGPKDTPILEGHGFQQLLIGAVPPTSLAAETRRSLLDWLDARRLDGWRLALS